jgi:hypothetical protein
MRQQCLFTAALSAYLRPYATHALKEAKDTCRRRVELQPVGTLARRAWGVSICTFVLIQPVK